jgi:myo-inositol 2-dehydrogenase/D-chiro-inositol 1-dehydrogenase
MITICQFGAGRIGAIHAANVARRSDVRLKYVVDVNAGAAGTLARKHGASVVDRPTALADGEVNAVIIASATDTHAELAIAAARAGKAIFCEKPIDLSLARVDECLKAVSAAKVPMFVGFNRRFDPSFAALRRDVRAGRIGRVEQVVITSRDPGLPPVEYLKVSGGLFRDMTIHDLDMARWLLGEEPVEIHAWGSVLVDPKVKDVGDIDSAMLTLRTASGALCHINNSRRAVYGYDQRIEVFGATGMLQAGNRVSTTVSHWGQDAVSADKPLFFFLERYADAYAAELDHFVDVLQGKAEPQVSGEDGRHALVLAEAAYESLKTGRPAPIPA